MALFLSTEQAVVLHCYFPSPFFPPKTIHYKAPAVTDLCACDQTFLLLILWVFYKRWLWFLDVCSVLLWSFFTMLMASSMILVLLWDSTEFFSLRRVHLHFDDRLICITALCTILWGNSVWFQNPDCYPTAHFWGSHEIIWVLVQEQYQLSHQVIWSVLSNVCI